MKTANTKWIQEELFTPDEEKLITNILEQYKLEISDSRHLTEVLTNEIEKAEIENIHEILENQEQWAGVMTQLTINEKQLIYMDGWLTKYHEKLEVFFFIKN